MEALLILMAFYFVSTTGNDSNPGTQGSPFLTIAKGVSVLVPGDTLFLRGGSYVGHNQFDLTPGGNSWAVPVTINAFEGETVTILGTTSTLHVVNLAKSYQQYIVFDDLIIDGQYLGADNIKLHWEGASAAAHHIRFQNGVIKRAGNQGVLIGSNAGVGGYHEFINMLVHENGLTVGFDHGFYIGSEFNLIDGCEIYANAGYGVHIFGGEESNHDNVVRNSLTHDHVEAAGILFGKGSGHHAYNNISYNDRNGLTIQFLSSGTLSNNTVYNSASHGIFLNTPVFAGASIIENNICYDNPLLGIYIQGVQTAPTVRNNLCSQNGTPAQFRDDSGLAILSGNLFGNEWDPKFVSAVGHDFHLLAGSHALDAGIAVAGVLTDKDGVNRPQGTAFDMGAYERAVAVAQGLGYALVPHRILTVG